MTRPRSHDTDEAAQRIFKSLLPTNWQPRDWHPDYRIDGFVEIFENEQPTGLMFAVQLKGTEKLKRTPAVIRFPGFKTEHLAYFVDHVQLPGFLVVVDVKNKLGYWLFLQSYGVDRLHGKLWRQRKTITIRIPVENDLHDIRRFRNAVEAAKQRMTELHPGAIGGSIEAETRRLEGIDPRFSVEIRASGRSVNICLQPKENVKGQFKLKGPPEELQPKFELLQRGHVVTFRPGELSVEGLPLLDDFAKHGGAMQFSRTYDVDVHLAAYDSTDAEIATLDHVPGKLSGGIKEMRLVAELPDAPLRIELPVTPGDRVANPMASMAFPCAAWCGQPITLLAYFDPLEQLLLNIERLHRLRVRVSWHGNMLVDGTFADLRCDALKTVRHFARVLGKARRVARELGVNPIVPRDFCAEHAHETDKVFHLITETEHRQPIPDMTASCLAPVEEVRRMLEEAKKEDADVTLHLQREPRTYPFLGTEVDLGPMEFIVVDAALANDWDELQRAVEDLCNEAVELRFKGTEKTQLIERVRKP